MAKLKNPLLSLDARNSLARTISFVRRRGQNIAEARPDPPDARTLAQLSWRHMYQKGVALWHALSAAEKLDWESQARSRHMTGFAWFMSQALKPNPGLYLPLQGGTMSGDIDMAKNRLLKLPLPVDSQEAITLAYYNANIEPLLMNEGARVSHSAAQNIADSTFTALAFDTERWDTDTIHDNAVNNSRLTCKTAGKYLIIGQMFFVAAAAGIRYAMIEFNGITYISAISTGLRADDAWYINVSTIADLAVTDYVEFTVYQNSGGALWAGIAADYSLEFMMQRIGA